MSESQIRAAAGDDDPAVGEFYAEMYAAKAERERAAAVRLAAREAEHGKLRPIRRRRR